MTRILLTLSLCAGLACGDDDDSEPDASADASRGDPDADEACGNASDCSDGIYCNGAEQCDPEDRGADERGCVSGAARCPGQCDEAAETCEGDCADADGDGRADLACGGDDCDDADADRFPGNTEVCDSMGVDEDCDDSTIGDDADDDGFVSDECCQQTGSGLRCGDDCDDDSADINPDTIDICGNGDQDCDGDVDEDPNELVYVDGDGDGYGVTPMSVMACTASAGYARLGGDCDDADDSVNPGEAERCDGGSVDEDCNGTINDGCECETGTTQPCGMSNQSPCRFGTQTCILDAMGRSVWGTCVDAIDPMIEICDAIDNDCDGSADNGASFECVRGTVEMGSNGCGRMGTRTCVAEGMAGATTCGWNPPDFALAESAATCDYCDDTGTGLNEGAFATVVGTVAVPAITDFDSSSGNQTSVRFTAPLEIGYGSVVLDVTEQVDEPTSGLVLHGWAIVMVREDLSAPQPLLGNGGAELGVPRTRDGMSVEWRWDDGSTPAVPCDSANDDDSLVLRHLRETAADPEVASAADPGPDAYTCNLHGSTTRRVQRVRVTVQPDPPGDAANQTAVTVEFDQGGWMPAIACGGTSGLACPFRIATGERYHFGVTASVANTTQVPTPPPPGSFVRNGLCP